MLIVGLLVLNFFATAQLKDVLNKAKQKANEKINKAADSSINKKETDPVNNKPAATKDTTQPGSVSIKAYSKYDFVPGEKVIGFEDFSTGNIGDFPAGWNTTSSGEIVTIEGRPGRWLWLTKEGAFVPEFADKYPDDFTFEFDLLHGYSEGGFPNHIYLSLVELENVKQPQNWGVANNRYTIMLLYGQQDQQSGNSESDVRQNAEGIAANTVETKQLGFQSNPVHISVWRQKERVRVYMNEEKVWDIPKALLKDVRLNSLVFFLKYVDPNYPYYISNLRLAVGAPDTRNKMLTQNKWVTHGILFDVNSDKIKPESYGTLKEMANVMKEYADLKVKIVGHTDADGNDAANLDLSKRRAASVKTMLAKEFGIDETRMQTDGKGESEPIDKNDNPAGKANNRRVEFIKM